MLVPPNTEVVEETTSDDCFYHDEAAQNMQYLFGDSWCHIGVSVSISAHPCCHLDRRLIFLVKQNKTKHIITVILDLDKFSKSESSESTYSIKRERLGQKLLRRVVQSTKELRYSMPPKCWWFVDEQT